MSPDLALFDMVEVRFASVPVDLEPSKTPEPWTEQANCRGVYNIKDILSRCQSCPVMQQCLQEGVTRQLTGPYGGNSLRRGKVVRQGGW
jgi:hypothetical protein